MKLNIQILSDPKGGEEALGRVFNAFGLAAEALRQGDDVQIVFAGTGTRWPAELAKLGHPLNALYNEIRPAIQGASCGCGQFFGASSGLEASNVPQLQENKLPGAPAPISSIRKYLAEDWETLVF